jgi:hypothetical protein
MNDEERTPKPTDAEDIKWFREFANSAQISLYELLGCALVHATTGRGDVQGLFEDRRSQWPAFWDRFERLTDIKCDYEGEGWCFFQCSC